MGLGVGLFGVRENGGGAVSLQKKASVFGADDTEFSRCFIAITEIFFQTTWSTTAVGESWGQGAGTADRPQAGAQPTAPPDPPLLHSD